MVGRRAEAAEAQSWCCRETFERCEEGRFLHEGSGLFDCCVVAAGDRSLLVGRGETQHEDARGVIQAGASRENDLGGRDRETGAGVMRAVRRWHLKGRD